MTAASRTLVIGSDHAGLPLKLHLKKTFPEIEWLDVGPSDAQRVDYPDFADKLVSQIRKSGGQGVLICGSGQGMAMRANRSPEIRAAVCWDEVSTRLSREHNDANVFCVGARLIPFGLAEAMLRIWLNTPFAGDRHQGRVDKLKLPI